MVGVNRIDQAWLTEQNRAYRWRVCVAHDAPLRARTDRAVWDCPHGRCTWMPLEVSPDCRADTAMPRLKAGPAPSAGIGIGVVLAWVVLVGTALGTISQVVGTPWWVPLALFYPVLMPVLFAHGRWHDSRLMHFAAANNMRLVCADTLRPGDLVSRPGQNVMLPVLVRDGRLWVFTHPDGTTPTLPCTPGTEVWVLASGTPEHRDAVCAAFERLRSSRPPHSPSPGPVVPVAP